MFKNFLMDETGAELPVTGNVMMFHPLGLRDFRQGAVHLRGNDW